MTDLKSIADRLEGATGPDNALDMAVEIALFKPDREHVAVRPNAAGTKLIYTTRSGGEHTFWANDYTLNAESRASTLALVRSLLTKETE